MKMKFKSDVEICFGNEMDLIELLSESPVVVTIRGDNISCDRKKINWIFKLLSKCIKIFYW